MNTAELDAAIEQANRIFSRQHGPGDRTQRNAKLPTSGPNGTDWRSERLDAVLRFGQPHAKLFPFVGRKVRTPGGPGILLQVFAERVTVLLEADLDKRAFFKPAEVEPISWELP